MHRFKDREWLPIEMSKGLNIEDIDFETYKSHTQKQYIIYDCNAYFYFAFLGNAI